jgi:acyl dehydratase
MTQPVKRLWADIDTGEVFETLPITITRREILEFAADFDPQPYHLDPEAADQSIFGGLCASGWHVTAVMMRLLTDRFMQEHIDLLGSAGVSRLRWRKPVFADDTLTARITVTARTPPAAGAGFGFIECSVEVSNQAAEPVIVLSTSLMIGQEQEVSHG